MKQSTSTILYSLLFAIGVGLICFAAVAAVQSSQRSEQATSAKVKVRDDLCMLVRVTLSTDEREIRRGGPLRDQIVARFGSDHVGDGADPITWCVDGGFDFDRFRNCQGDGVSDVVANACMADMIAHARDRVRP